MKLASGRYVFFFPIRPKYDFHPICSDRELHRSTVCAQENKNICLSADAAYYKKKMTFYNISLKDI